MTSNENLYRGSAGTPPRPPHGHEGDESRYYPEKPWYQRPSTYILAGIIIVAATSIVLGIDHFAHLQQAIPTQTPPHLCPTAGGGIEGSPIPGGGVGNPLPGPTETPCP